MSRGQYIADWRSGRPSPLKPCTPLPAQVQITPRSAGHAVSSGGVVTCVAMGAPVPKRIARPATSGVDCT
jgi:hypothetical protein